MPDGRDHSRDLSRLLAPRAIAVVGGGAWCASIIGAAERIGYRGTITPIHPAGKIIAGLQALSDLNEIAGPIDAAFIGVNRHATLEVVQQLRGMGAGGAICFASGFSEAKAEAEDGTGLQQALLDAAGEMPVLGPNCYGFVNALDRTAIWPDQHGMGPIDRGVAILTQSSNIAINLTMQQRGLPIGAMITCGNSAQTSQAALALHLLKDPRITALGLHIEGFGDLREWELLAQAAHTRNIPLVALKVGRSEQAQAAATSHTASLAGSDAGAQALLDRLGISRVHDLPTFIETLKLLHVTGRVAGPRLGAISCSGGEASLVADMASDKELDFPPLTEPQRKGLRDALGPMVALNNPLDYHTHVWRDADAMARAWASLVAGPLDATICIVDYPTTDATDWACATEAAIAVRGRFDKPFIMAATLPELMPPTVAGRLMEGGVVPVGGLAEAIGALVAAQPAAQPVTLPVLQAHPAPGEAVLLSEAEAKARLQSFGVNVPLGGVAETAGDLVSIACDLSGPFALKRLGLAHKSEANAVRLNLFPDTLWEAAVHMGDGPFLLEEMVSDTVVELLVGVLRDPAHGFVLTLAAGGVLTELIGQTVSLLVPASRKSVTQALTELPIWALLQGYRGKPGADIEAVIDGIMAVQKLVMAHAVDLLEMEINPMICTPRKAVAADALMRISGEEGP